MATVPSSPPVEITGAWEVRFQPNRAATERVTFEKLISWSAHGDPGVRHFSGTASYRTSFDWSPEKGSPADRPARVFLDLGRVAVIADVTLNGQPLRTLWKPPFRIEVTGALKPGANRLEVSVANLWVNRQIGDEQLPEDSERNADGTLKQWPQWLLDGKPSPAGRHTFTTWRLWKKDDAPLKSGLMGPVSLRLVQQVELREPAAATCVTDE